MAKKRGQQPPREATKRQLSRWQQQKKRQRFILASGIFIIVAVLSITGTGWYITQYRPLHQTVIRVNDTHFDMNYYIKMLKYYGADQPTQYMQYVADEVVRAIEQNELIKQEAMKLGISISNDAVDEELKSRDPPLSKDYRDSVRAEMLIKKLWDEYFEQEVPLSTEQRHIMAMFLESKSQAVEISAKLESDGSFAELAGEFSLDYLSKEKGGDLGWQLKDILAELLRTSVPGEYAFDSEVGVLSQPIYDEDKTKGVGYWLIEVLERNEESDEANVQAILLGSQEEAQEIRARLEAGEDFAGLAIVFSQHDSSKGNGGDLGWLTPDTVPPALDEFVSNSELEIISEPIRDETAWTRGGYWLVKVLDKDDYRKISDDDRDLLKSKALDEWVSSLGDDPKNRVENYLDEDKKSWAISRAIKELGQ